MASIVGFRPVPRDGARNAEDADEKQQPRVGVFTNGPTISDMRAAADWPEARR